MRAIGGMTRTLAVAMMVLAGLLAMSPAVGAKPGNNGGPGNSGAAQQCKQGGWQSLVREDGSGFANQGDCVSYAAQGGTLTVPDTRTMSLSWIYRTQHPGSSQYEICYARISVANFPAGEHTITIAKVSGVGDPNGITLTVSVGPDGKGSADTSQVYGEGLLGAWYASTEPGDMNIDEWQAVVTATTADGLVTTSTASCQRPA